MFLIFFYIPRGEGSFLRIDFITRENLSGFIFRRFHLNSASLIFVILYIHVARGIFFFRFRLFTTWQAGVTILLLSIISAFLGYVLPFGQISFWGATVITNLVRVVPFVGETLVLWLWGGFCINKITISFFFLLHFLTPLLIMGLVMFHLISLHSSRRTSPIFIHENLRKIKFFPYFVKKDFINFFFLIVFLRIILFSPWVLGDPENWIKANPMMSPVHIQPEWYFLFAYAILRCIPRKIGGVIALVLRVTILYFLAFNFSFFPKRLKISYIFIFFFRHVFFILTWLGGCPVEAPYIALRQIYRRLYFILFFIFYV